MGISCNIAYTPLEMSILHELELAERKTRPQLTRKIKEVQAERQTLRQATMDVGRHRGKTHEWVCVHDTQYCECAVLTAVEEGATTPPQLKKFVTHVKQLLGTSEKLTSAPR